MKYLLISTKPITIALHNQETKKQEYTLVPENSIINCIEYDGVSPYTPPDNCILIKDTNSITHIGSEYEDK